jgi:hypothetical protein
VNSYIWERATDERRPMMADRMGDLLDAVPNRAPASSTSRLAESVWACPEHLKAYRGSGSGDHLIHLSTVRSVS